MSLLWALPLILIGFGLTMWGWVMAAHAKKFRYYTLAAFGLFMMAAGGTSLKCIIYPTIHIQDGKATINFKCYMAKDINQRPANPEDSLGTV